MTATWRALPLLLVAGLLGCAGWREAPASSRAAAAQEPYRPDRRDYMAFKQAYPDVLEPNYLPFMVHRMPGDPVTGDVLLFCRWPDEAMPLPVYIDSPVIPDSLQDEFDPVDPARFTDAVARALDTWQKELGGLVSFRRVTRPEEALLRLRVLAEPAPSPEPDLRVLGSTEALRRACQTHGWDPESERMNVTFTVPETIIYAADEFGLLTDVQVEAIALHEIGHALGMLGHSPVPSDVMYRSLDGRGGVPRLSDEDVNSFVSLYQLPNGTHYGEVAPGGPPPRPDPGPPSGGPQLSLAPHVDARLGFELHTPAGWLRASEPHGLFTANGPIWDHDVSLEIFVWPAPSVDAYLDRFGQGLFAGTWRRYSAPAEIASRPAREVAVEDPSGREALDFFFVDLGDGRVMMILTDAPVEVDAAWRPWFRAAIDSLEIWGAGGPKSR